jgi:hypothetical protein
VLNLSIPRQLLTRVAPNSDHITKGISSGLTHPADVNGTSWSVYVESRTHFVSQSGPPGRRDAFYPTLSGW